MIDTFADKIIAWHQVHGRHDLPWQLIKSPYPVWVSEIMLQQTQVKTVIPYYQRFMQRFTTIQSLAAATEDEVLNYWSGLGYYARARNLHRTAKIVSQQFNGSFPNSINELCALPGIGRSTAGAILSLAHNQFAPILDGNVKRILCRVHAIDQWPGEARVLTHLWQLSEQHTPTKQTNIYNQAMMDLGSDICTRQNPKCSECPVQQECAAFLNNKQQQYPVPKPHKNLPSKETFMLIFMNQQGEVLLQKRPPVGIWGGLWSFPECKEQQHIANRIQDDYPFATLSELTELPGIKHQFTHFRLQINPYLIKLKSQATMKIMENSDEIWYKLASKLNLGVPEPVQRLLNHIAVSPISLPTRI